MYKYTDNTQIMNPGYWGTMNRGIENVKKDWT